MISLHALFYGPLWALLVLWAGSCGELAARVRSLTWMINILGGVEKPPKATSEVTFSPNDDDTWKNVRNRMRDLHDDAKKMSAWWTVYALGGLLTNGYYLSSRYHEKGDDLSTLAGLSAGILSRLERRDVQGLATFFFPLALSLIQVLACELLPNLANAKLRSTVKRHYIRLGQNEPRWRACSAAPNGAASRSVSGSLAFTL